MKKIDAHLHLAKIIAGYCRRGESRAIGDGKIAWGNGEIMQLIPEEIGGENFTVEAAIELMNTQEVEKAVLMQGSLYGFQNRYYYEVMKKYPDKFCAACTVDPYMTNYLETLEYFIKEQRFTLIKFEVSSGGGLMGCHDAFDLAGERMMKIYKLAEKYNVVIALDIGDIDMDSHQTMALVRILDKCPNLTLVICHLMAPNERQHREWVHELGILNRKNIYFDISSLPKILDDIYPFTLTVKYLREAIDILGVEKLMWGTDIPFAGTRDSYMELTNYLEKSNAFTPEELQAIYYNNANRIYFRL